MTGNFSLFQSPVYKRYHAWSETQCIKNVISKSPPDDGLLYCTPRHDHFMGCWNFTLAGSRAYLPCPELPGFSTENFAYFDCLPNGSWYVHPSTGKEYANYMGCRNYQQVLKETEEDLLHVYVSIAGFSISLLLLISALVIFFSFRQLNCDRIAVHKNLFISYVISDLFNVIYLSVVCLDESVLMQNPLWCRVLHVITQYAVVSNFAWMFCEGLFLHTLIMNALKSGHSVIMICFIIGWMVPLGLTAVYAGIRATLSDNIEFCWLYESSLQWITFAPVVLSMMVNIVFLINIMRLLVTKLRQLPEAAQTRKAVRATGILIPLLGLQFLLFIKRPNDKESMLYDVYTYAVSVVVSLQGAFVSILYCFCNGEVLTLLQRKWYQHRMVLPGKRKRAQSSSASTMYTFIDQVSQGNTNML
ncbi:calcitonin receptor-like [Saccostrea echinata]|uniref:calcitonin receptor-like n=1 Tax=Saccostrea echinata TaxID=191078 RepID=UPI002A7F7AF4|nr:calcitonin receptor-like [Saccostrea echinata]